MADHEKKGILIELILVLLPKANSGYRPIYLISFLVKGFEAILEVRLRIFDEEQGLLSPSQYGSQKKGPVHTAI